MTSHKKDRTNRAYIHGLKAGFNGISIEKCPYESVLTLRGVWLGGWRQGRDQRNWGIKSLRTAAISVAIA